MIESFRCKNTEALNAGMRVKEFQAFEKVARRKLAMLEAAARLEDLKAPPGNQLEALRDDRQGQHSIRINDQWRLCFQWRDGNAYGVEIVAFH